MGVRHKEDFFSKRKHACTSIIIYDDAWDDETLLLGYVEGVLMTSQSLIFLSVYIENLNKCQYCIYI